MSYNSRSVYLFLSWLLIPKLFQRKDYLYEVLYDWEIVGYFLFTRESHFKIIIVLLKWHFLPDSISKVLCYSFTSLLWKHYDFIDSDSNQVTSWHSKLVCGMLIPPPHNGLSLWRCHFHTIILQKANYG